MAVFSRKNLNIFYRVQEILQDRKFFNKYKFYKYNSEIVELGRDILFDQFDKINDFYISLFNLKSLCKWIEDELSSGIYKESKSHISMEVIKDFCVNLSKSIWEECDMKSIK